MNIAEMLELLSPLTTACANGCLCPVFLPYSTFGCLVNASSQLRGQGTVAELAIPEWRVCSAAHLILEDFLDHKFCAQVSRNATAT